MIISRFSLRSFAILFAAAFGLVASTTSAQIMVTNVVTPPGSFSSEETNNLTLNDGDVLVLTYGDDNGNGTGASTFRFNSATNNMTLAEESQENRTSSELYYYVNDSGSDITADAVVDGNSGFMYGLFTLSNVDLSNPIGPVENASEDVGGSVDNSTLGLTLSNVTSGQHVFSVASNGNGDTTITPNSPLLNRTNATSGGGGGSYAVADYAVSSNGSPSLSWGFENTGGLYRNTMIAVAFNQVPEPSTGLLVLGGLGLLALGRRHRSRRS